MAGVTSKGGFKQSLPGTTVLRSTYKCAIRALVGMGGTASVFLVKKLIRCALEPKKLVMIKNFSAWIMKGF